MWLRKSGYSSLLEWTGPWCQKIQRLACACWQAHRVLWLYIAIFDLAGLSGKEGAASKRQDVVRSAIGHLAASAPCCLLVGLQASSERLEAELWERLQYLGRWVQLGFI